MSAAQIERLAWLSEELGEAQQAIGKILRFGYGSPTTMYNNKAYLEDETGHIQAALDLMMHSHDLSSVEIITQANKKAANVKQYLLNQ